MAVRCCRIFARRVHFKEVNLTPLGSHYVYKTDSLLESIWPGWAQFWQDPLQDVFCLQVGFNMQICDLTLTVAPTLATTCTRLHHSYQLLVPFHCVNGNKLSALDTSINYLQFWMVTFWVTMSSSLYEGTNVKDEPAAAIYRDVITQKATIQIFNAITTSNLFVISTN